jgi:hypothetical protein
MHPYDAISRQLFRVKQRKNTFVEENFNAPLSKETLPNDSCIRNADFCSFSGEKFNSSHVARILFRVLLVIGRTVSHVGGLHIQHLHVVIINNLSPK